MKQGGKKRSVLDSRRENRRRGKKGRGRSEMRRREGNGMIMRRVRIVFHPHASIGSPSDILHHRGMFAPPFAKYDPCQVLVFSLAG